MNSLEGGGGGGGGEEEVFFLRFAFVFHSTLTRPLPSKRKNVCGEARLTFTFADSPVLYCK